MSHPVNDEILETLYEEELEWFNNNPTIHGSGGLVMTKQDIETAAEIMARKRFESMCY